MEGVPHHRACKGQQGKSQDSLGQYQTPTGQFLFDPHIVKRNCDQRYRTCQRQTNQRPQVHTRRHTHIYHIPVEVRTYQQGQTQRGEHYRQMGDPSHSLLIGEVVHPSLREYLAHILPHEAQLLELVFPDVEAPTG